MCLVIGVKHTNLVDVNDFKGSLCMEVKAFLRVCVLNARRSQTWARSVMVERSCEGEVPMVRNRLRTVVVTKNMCFA